MGQSKKTAKWQEAFWYDDRTDDVWCVYECSRCGWKRTKSMHEQFLTARLAECPQCQAIIIGVTDNITEGKND